MVLVETNSSPHDPHAREKFADPPKPEMSETPRGLVCGVEPVLSNTSSTVQFGAIP